MMHPDLKELLENLYVRYNRREYVHPDPLEFLYRYDNLLDREIAALIASSLAYGRVAQICCSVAALLDRMNPSPAEFLDGVTEKALFRIFGNFKHRFTTCRELVEMLLGIQRVVAEYGSLHACVAGPLKKKEPSTIIPGLCALVDALLPTASPCSSLLPLPERGSACKRLHLFLRWMVRSDDVDPGGWKDISASLLCVPLDTHMQRICRSLGMTARKQADMKTVEEVTAAFRRLNPEDPVRYDFVLTRLGMWDRETLKLLINTCGTEEAA